MSKQSKTGQNGSNNKMKKNAPPNRGQGGTDNSHRNVTVSGSAWNTALGPDSYEDQPAWGTGGPPSSSDADAFPPLGGGKPTKAVAKQAKTKQRPAKAANIDSRAFAEAKATTTAGSPQATGSEAPKQGGDEDGDYDLIDMEKDLAAEDLLEPEWKGGVSGEASFGRKQ